MKPRLHADQDDSLETKGLPLYTGDERTKKAKEAGRGVSRPFPSLSKIMMHGAGVVPQAA